MQTTSAISHARRRPGLFRRLRLRAGDDLPSLKPQTQRTYGSSRPKDPKAPVNLQILENDESLLGFRVCNPIPSDLVHRAPTFRGAIFEKMRTRSMDVLFDSPFSFWCSGFGESARPFESHPKASEAQTGKSRVAVMSLSWTGRFLDLPWRFRASGL